MDEKSFRRGHSYITLLTDLEESRVLDVVEERTTKRPTDYGKPISAVKQAVEAMWWTCEETVYPDDSKSTFPTRTLCMTNFTSVSICPRRSTKSGARSTKELMAEMTRGLKAPSGCGCIIPKT